MAEAIITNDRSIVRGGEKVLSENGKINRLSGWKHTKTFQVYVYIAMNAIMCLSLFFAAFLAAAECEAGNDE